MYRYLLHGPGGEVLGEATRAVLIHPGEEVLVGGGKRFRVLNVLPFDDEESSLVGSLHVEPRGPDGAIPASALTPPS